MSLTRDFHCRRFRYESASLPLFAIRSSVSALSQITRKKRCSTSRKQDTEILSQRHFLLLFFYVVYINGASNLITAPIIFVPSFRFFTSSCVIFWLRAIVFCMSSSMSAMTGA